MTKAIIEFTLNGRKHTYFRRNDLFGKPLTTTNKNSAKYIKKSNIKNIINSLNKTYGKNNITQINIIEDEA